MKTVQEIKNRIFDTIKYSVIRPEMYAHDSFGVESFLRGILGDIIFIDEQEADLEAQFDKLRDKGLFTAQGVAGHLSHCFSSVDNVSKETASVYAEIAYNLGYLKIDSLLISEDWNSIYNNIRNHCRNQDWRLEDIVNMYGPPSLEIGSVWQRIHCYVSKDVQDEWIFFDYWNEYLENFDEDPDNRYKYKTNPILRNVRLPSKKFKRGIVFTPYGKKL